MVQALTMRFGLPVIALTCFAGPASAINLFTADFEGRYWHTTPTGQLTHPNGSAGNDLDNELGFDATGHSDIHVRLGLPAFTLDGYNTPLALTGKAEMDGTYDGTYSKGDDSTLEIGIRHFGLMFNPLSFLEVVDIGYGLGLTTVSGKAEVGTNEDSKDALLLTAKGELRVLPDSSWSGSLRYHESSNLRDVAADIRYRVATYLDVMGGYRQITFEDPRLEGRVAGPYAGVSLTF